MARIDGSVPGGCMRAKVRSLTPALVVVAATVALYADTLGSSFDTLQSGFSQSLFGVTDAFGTKTSILGGVVVLPSGDVLVEECATAAAPQLHRFSAATTNTHSTDIHVETIIPLALPSASWC